MILHVMVEAPDDRTTLFRALAEWKGCLKAQKSRREESCQRRDPFAPKTGPKLAQNGRSKTQTRKTRKNLMKTQPKLGAKTDFPNEGRQVL